MVNLQKETSLHVLSKVLEVVLIVLQDDKLADGAAGHARLFCWRRLLRNQTSDRFGVLRDHKLLTWRKFANQLRQMGLRMFDSDGHVELLLPPRHHTPTSCATQAMMRWQRSSSLAPARARRRCPCGGRAGRRGAPICSRTPISNGSRQSAGSRIIRAA